MKKFNAVVVVVMKEVVEMWWRSAGWIEINNAGSVFVVGLSVEVRVSTLG